MKLFFCDLETTGLDPQKHAIIQCAGSIVIDVLSSLPSSAPILASQPLMLSKSWVYGK